jgi:hypothetical protein
MMRLASASRVTKALSLAARALWDLCSKYHAVSNADLNVSVDSRSKPALLRRGSIGIAALAGACVLVTNLQKYYMGEDVHWRLFSAIAKHQFSYFKLENSCLIKEDALRKLQLSADLLYENS